MYAPHVGRLTIGNQNCGGVVRLNSSV